MLKEDIAAKLEQAFSAYGFTEPSVSRLQKECGVSLRTLYKYYPSKESMIISALDYRHKRYLALLQNTDSSLTGSDVVLQTFDKLEMWMQKYAPHGCLSMSAIAAFPDHVEINQTVKKHKDEVRNLLHQQSGSATLANSLFLLHEGISNAWPVFGKESVVAAKAAALILLQEEALL